MKQERKKQGKDNMKYEIHKGTKSKKLEAKGHLHALKKFLGIRKANYLTKQDFRRRFGKGTEIEVVAFHFDPVHLYDMVYYTYNVKETSKGLYYSLKHVGA